MLHAVVSSLHGQYKTLTYDCKVEIAVCSKNGSLAIFWSPQYEGTCEDTMFANSIGCLSTISISVACINNQSNRPQKVPGT